MVVYGLAKSGMFMVLCGVLVVGCERDERGSGGEFVGG